MTMRNANPMTCRFLDDLTLGALLAPVTEEEFRTRYFERKPLLVARTNREFYGDLLSLEDFDKAVANAPSYVKTAEAKSKKTAKHQGGTTSGLEQTLAEMRNGATLVLDQLQDREPKLGLLCRLLEQQLGYRFQTNCYLTPPQGAGFTPHWDNHDVFILQVLGSKHWKVEKQRRRLPGKTEYMAEEEGRVVAPDALSFTLDQGDLIYIPRGVVHAAECGSEPSLHITLGLNPYTWEDLLSAAMKALGQQDERLRYTLPPSFMSGDRDLLVKGLMAALREANDETFLNAVVDQFRDELVSKFPLDISGQITGFFQPTQLGPDDKIEPRRGIVYRMHVENDSVRLNFGARSIVFPGFFRDALEFALKTPGYAIRSLPGDLEEEEKIVFIERLLQEGLVVRKLDH